MSSRVVDVTTRAHSTIHHALSLQDGEKDVLLILGAAFLDACLTHEMDTDEAVAFLRNLSENALPEIMN